MGRRSKRKPTWGILTTRKIRVVEKVIIYREMKKTKTIARHGDILFKRTNKTVGKKQRSKTVAYGEVTGHHHTFDGGAVCFAEDGEVKSVEILSATPIKHQEHDAIMFEKGKYDVYKKTEYDPFEKVIRQVKD